MNSFKSWGKRAWALAAMPAAWMWALPALGDGKVYPAVAFPADVTIPDQSALIVWEEGVERLVIETRFVGEGTNFAWVVPLPSVPEIEPATTGLFPTLRYNFQPEVRHDVYSWWAAALFVYGLVWLMATVRRNERLRLSDLMACALTAGGFAVASHSPPVAVLAGPALFLLLLLTASRVRGGRERAYAFLVTVLLVLVLSSLLLPSLGTAGRAMSEEGGDLRVLDRKIVGVYETTTIEAREAGALFDWLNQNGFALDASSKPVVEDYVRDGWVFVACKVNRDLSSALPVTPHPLSFSFRTARAVYPLRLTGVGSRGLELELFVAGTGRARVDGFTVMECRPFVRVSSDGTWRMRSGGEFGHPQLLDWAKNAAVITRLKATLGAAAMELDAEVGWEDFSPAQSRVYSRQGAALTAANWTVPLAGLLILVVCVRVHKGRLPSRQAAKAGFATLLALGMVAFAIYATLPKVTVRIQRWPGGRAKTSLQRLAKACAESYPSSQTVDLPSVRKQIALQLKPVGDLYTENLLLGGQIHEEDSPGNYALRETADGVEIIGHDATGARVVLGSIPAPKSP